MAMLQLLCIVSLCYVVTTPVVLIPQVIVTLVCKVISTNCLCIIVKELSTYIHLLYSDNTLYMKPSGDCDNILWVGITTPLDQRFIQQLCA